MKSLETFVSTAFIGCKLHAGVTANSERATMYQTSTDVTLFGYLEKKVLSKIRVYGVGGVHSGR